MLDAESLTVRHFISHTLIHELLHLDGKIWRTLRQLFLRPGFLTEEYCAGRWRLYINPLRLFITAVLVYALFTRGGLHASMFLGPLTLSIAPTAVPHGASVKETVAQLDRFGILERLLAEQQKVKSLDSEAASEKFHARLERLAGPLSFTNVLLLASVLYAAFRRSRGLFVQHGVFAMHFLSFVLFSSLVFLPATWIDWSRSVTGWFSKLEEGIVFVIIILAVVWQFVYLAIAIRRFYLRDDRRRFWPALFATGAAFLLYILNSVFMTVVQLLGGAFALWTA